MPSPHKIKLVDTFRELFSQAKSVVFTDYRGLTHLQLEELRHKVEEAGGVFNVTKNKLVQLALKQNLPTESQALDNETFKGPTATLFCLNDEVLPIKILKEFMSLNNLPTVKSGFLGATFLDKNAVAQLANTPSKPQLIAQLMGKIQSPLIALQLQLNSPIQNLILDLKVIAGGEQNG